MTRKDVKFIWIDQCEEFFESIKFALTHAHVLIPPIFGERFEIFVMLY
jgi:hypothetical protein